MKKVNLQDDIKYLHSRGVLGDLLYDHTTDKNILFGDATEITVETLLRGNVKPRFEKTDVVQGYRTRNCSEVFTPAWMCRKMNDYLDTQMHEQGSILDSYTDLTVLEITCGEAPFLEDRYDRANGNSDDVCWRSGLLDRKLRWISDEIKDEKTWWQYAIRALKSVYGYEMLGDNLLIARINIITSFLDYLDAFWFRDATDAELGEVVSIVTWNLWQMDGLTGCVPYTNINALIYDWEQDCVRNALFHEFDYIIGNPPYQEPVLGKNSAKPLYHTFMDMAYNMSDRVLIIHPARCLFRNGRTPKQWNEQMLDDKHVIPVYYEKDSSAIFPDVRIRGGIVITYRDWYKDFGSIGEFIPQIELSGIWKKVQNAEGFISLYRVGMVYGRMSVKLTKKLHKDFPKAYKDLSDGNLYDMTTNVFDRLPYIFYDEKPQDGRDYLQMYGRSSGHRVRKYVWAEYVNEPDNLYKYKVAIPKAYGDGSLGEAIPGMFVLEPGMCVTQSYLTIGCFDTLEEAFSLLWYLRTKFVRVLLGISKTTQDITPKKWDHVPVQDFTNTITVRSFRSVDEMDVYLYAKYGLTGTEIGYIEANGKTVEYNAKEMA